jgi:hypothetical protein
MAPGFMPEMTEMRGLTIEDVIWQELDGLMRGLEETAKEDPNRETGDEGYNTITVQSNLECMIDSPG